MLALEEMQKQNYQKALEYTAAARQWPENLGVGKPYENDIDERLENWLDFQNYTKLENKPATQQALGKILSFTSSLAKDRRPSANDLVYAWALQQSGKEGEAEKLLKDAVLRSPEKYYGKMGFKCLSK
jgi:hypothetical protein